MSWLTKSFSYSIGKKIIMGLTGLFLVVFLVEHLIGNLKLLNNDGGAAFIEYSHNMVHDIIIRIIEVFLFLALILHVIDGVALSIQNRRARPVGYVKKNRNANSFWTSRNMIVSGLLVLFFLIVHLKTFFVPYRITGMEEGKDIYKLCVDAFQDPLYSGFYLFSLTLLALHLHHGFASAFQSLGLRHPKYTQLIKGFSVFLSVALCLGFAIIPLYFLFVYDKI